MIARYLMLSKPAASAFASHLSEPAASALPLTVTVCWGLGARSWIVSMIALFFPIHPILRLGDVNDDLH